MFTRKSLLILSLSVVMSLLLVISALADELVHYTRAWDVVEKDAVTIVKDRIEQKYPDIKVKVIWGSTGKSREYLLTAAATGTFPDVFDGSPRFSSEFGPLGYFADLSSFVDWDDLLPFVPKIIGWEGKIYSVPVFVDPGVMYYRKDMFDESGIAPAQPGNWWTWAQFTDAAKKLTKDPTSQDGTYGLAMAITRDNADTPSGFFWSAGSNYFDERNGVWSVDFGTGGKRAFNYLYDLYNTDKVVPIELVGTPPAQSILNGFWQGRFAMYSSTIWSRFQHINDAPEGFDFGKKWDFMPLPVDTSTALAKASMSGISVSEKSEYKDVALEMVQMHLEPEIADLWAFDQYQIPGTISGFQSPRYESMDFGWNRIHKLFTQYNYVYAKPNHPLRVEFGETIFMPRLVEFLLGDITVDQAIQEIEEAGNALLASFEE